MMASGGRGIAVKLIAVDDDTAFLELIRAVLAKAGFRDVTLATSAEAAAELIYDAKPPFDACFIDMRMPEIEGDQLCRWIRQLPQYRDAVILMITATSEKQDVERAFLAGASDYMSKPLDLVEFIARTKHIARSTHEELVEGRDGAVPAAEPEGAGFSEPVLIEGVERAIELSALENYLLQLSRSGVHEQSAVAFRIVGAARLHLSCAPEAFERILAAVARAILAHAPLSHPFVAYAGSGVFVVVSDASAAEEAERVGVEAAINHALAARAGGGPKLRVVMGRPQKLGSRTGQQVVDAMYHAIVDAEALSFAARLPHS
jgi:CheY-like chemotaxis protein